VPDTGEQQFPAFRPLPQQSLAAHMTAKLLAQSHYKSVVLDEALSVKIFDRYLKTLDPERIVFFQADIDQWNEERTKLSYAILNDDLTIPFAIFNLYARRTAERYTDARTMVRKGFEFRTNESYQYRREKEPWPKSADEMRELWRKRVKNDWLRLKLGGKDDKSIVAILDKRYDNFLKRIGRIKSA
jgi:carboxyl-terminal processing protease